MISFFAIKFEFVATTKEIITNSISLSLPHFNFLLCFNSATNYLECFFLSLIAILSFYLSLELAFSKHSVTSPFFIRFSYLLICDHLKYS